MFHSVYGLRIKSDLKIPGLLPENGKKGYDIRVFFQRSPAIDVFNDIERCDPHFTGRYFDENGNPTLRVWKGDSDGSYLFRYADGTEFRISGNGREVWANWPDSLSLEDTATYLLGPVFGFILRLRGEVCLHASAIAIKDRAVCILGPGGAGKSTIAAAFALRRYPIVTEDVLVIDTSSREILVKPGYPLIRLWPSSVKMMLESAHALPALTPNWDKRYLDLTRDGLKFQNEPLPLGAVYFLEERRESSDCPKISIKPIQSGLIDMVANAYTTYLIDKEMRAREFELIGQLVRNIPIRSLTPHSNPSWLPDLCEAILSDINDMS